MKQRSLHLCNVANMAYGYCKLLEAERYPVQLYCNNIKHIMSQPEWDDLDLDPDKFADENDYTKNQADFNGYQRPDWFHGETVLTFDKFPLIKLSWLFPKTVNQKIKPLYMSFWSWVSQLLRFNGKSSLAHSEWENRVAFLANASKHYGKEWEVTEDELALYLDEAKWLSQKYQPSDILFGYMYAPISLMLCGNIPTVSVEIGTIRDLPARRDMLSRILVLAYRMTDHLLITNPDGLQYAQQLGLENKCSFIPHPIDEDIYAPLPKGDNDLQMLRQQLNIPENHDFYLFAPARQNWEIKGNDKYLRAFAKLEETGVNGLLIIPAWGQEIEKSKQLCKQLGVKNVHWIKPMSEKRLIRYFQAVDVVLDQFNLGVFGLITPKAMACEKPVITSFNPSVHQWCFDEMPPVYACATTDEIHRTLMLLHGDRLSLQQSGNRSREWVVKHHSKTRVIEQLVKAMNSARENFKRIKNHEDTPLS